MEELRDLLLVGLQLVERAQEMGPGAARRFQFDHAQRQAVNEHHHIGPPVVLAVDDHELAHRKPVVLLWLLKVDERDFARRQRAVIGVVLHIHAFGDQLVQAAVFFEQ